MATTPYFKFYIGDYLADTAHLSTQEHGAYLLLMLYYYRNGGALPNDERRLSNIVKVSLKSFRQMRLTLSQFFEIDEKFWTHKRIEKELASYRDKCSKNKASIEKRWEKEDEKNDTTGIKNVYPLVSETYYQNDTISEVTSHNSEVRVQNSEVTSHNSEVIKTNNVDQAAPAQPRLVSKPHDPNVKKIFEHWQSVMNHPGAKLSEDRVKLIKQALKSGYTADQLCEAITGCSLTPFYMGDNDRGEIYDGLKHVFKNSDVIDKFLKYAKHPPKPRNKTEKIFDRNLSVAQSWAERKREELKSDR